MIINVDYNPLPAARLFHESPARNKLARGGKGSGKTQALLMEGWMLSQEYPGNVGLLGRETYGELKEVIIDPMLDLIPPELIAEFKKSDNKLLFTNGSVIYFRPLDEPRKVKGLNLGWFGIDEADAIPQEHWLQLDGQLRRPGVRHVAMATTNPTSQNHWIYDKWVKSQLPDHADFVFRTKENFYLPKDFIDNLYRNMPESWVKRYLEGEWGAISLGDRVFPDFSEKLHVYDHLGYNPQVPVIRVMDFGLAGHACIFFQLRGNMGADFLGEIFRKDMTSRQFALVVAKYSDDNFPKAIFEDYGDVAGNQRDVTSGVSPIEEIGKELHTTIRTEAIPLKDSLDLVRVKLSQVSQGTTALRFAPQMRLTIEALNGGYVFKKDKNGNIISDVPAADSIFEHVMDAFRYGVWHKFAFSRPEKKKFNAPKHEPVWEGSSW